MRFWDSSALVPLFVEQPSSDVAKAVFAEDAEAVLWWGSPVEVESAFARLRRDEVLDEAGIEMARSLFSDLRDGALEVEPSGEIRQQAIRLLANHTLRAADALQLAASLTWSERGTSGAAFVSFDERLRAAAQTEGFTVLPRDLPVP